MLNAQIIGNLGSDPELKAVSSGSLLRMNVAVNQRVRVEGEWTEKTEWCRVTVFGNRAETLANHLRKGMRVYVAGRLECRPWTGQQGDLKAGLEIVADTVEFMSSRQDDEGQGERPSNWKPIQQPAARAAKPAVEDSDLPF